MVLSGDGGAVTQIRPGQIQNPGDATQVLLGDGTFGTVPGSGSAVAIVTQRITSGNLTLSGTTSWTSASVTDLVIPAAVGDIIEVGLTRRHIAGSDGVWMDFASLVGGAPVNSWACDNAWSNSNTGMTFAGPSLDTFEGVVFGRAVASGDLSGGNLTLRLYYRNNGSPTPSSTLCASIASGVLYYSAKNLKH